MLIELRGIRWHFQISSLRSKFWWRVLRCSHFPTNLIKGAFLLTLSTDFHDNISIGPSSKHLHRPLGIFFGWYWSQIQRKRCFIRVNLPHSERPLNTRQGLACTTSTLNYAVYWCPYVIYTWCFYCCHYLRRCVLVADSSDPSFVAASLLVE